MSDTSDTNLLLTMLREASRQELTADVHRLLTSFVRTWPDEGSRDVGHAYIEELYADPTEVTSTSHDEYLRRRQPSFGNAPEAFIQWKGTTVCMDVHCQCGKSSHICGEDFAYYVKCGCGKLYAMPYMVPITPLPEEHARYVRENISGGCIKTEEEGTQIGSGFASTWETGQSMAELVPPIRGQTGLVNLLDSGWVVTPADRVAERAPAEVVVTVSDSGQGYELGDRISLEGFNNPSQNGIYDVIVHDSVSGRTQVRFREPPAAGRRLSIGYYHVEPDSVEPVVRPTQQQNKQTRPQPHQRRNQRFNSKGQGRSQQRGGRNNRRGRRK